MAFELEEPAPGSIALRLSVGSAAQCTLFGGDGKIDRPVAEKKAGLFKAVYAPAPASGP